MDEFEKSLDNLWSERELATKDAYSKIIKTQALAIDKLKADLEASQKLIFMYKAEVKELLGD